MINTWKTILHLTQLWFSDDECYTKYPMSSTNDNNAVWYKVMCVLANVKHPILKDEIYFDITQDEDTFEINFNWDNTTFWFDGTSERITLKFDKKTNKVSNTYWTNDDDEEDEGDGITLSKEEMENDIMVLDSLFGKSKPYNFEITNEIIFMQHFLSLYKVSDEEEHYWEYITILSQMFMRMIWFKEYEIKRNKIMMEYGGEIIRDNFYQEVDDEDDDFDDEEEVDTTSYEFVLTFDGDKNKITFTRTDNDNKTDLIAELTPNEDVANDIAVIKSNFSKK